MIRSLALTLCVVLGFLWVPEGSASVGEGLTLDELVARADEIVMARAIAAESRFEDGRIVTEVELERVETIRGHGGERLRLITPGGTVGEIGMRVEGAPQIPVGTEAVLFGRRTERGVRAVGMAQGVFPVRTREGRPWVHPNGAGIALVRRDAQGRLSRVSPSLEAPMELEAFLSEVRERAARR